MSLPDPPSAADTLASSPCLSGERVSFTGTLASMTHQQAHTLVEEHGGTATHHVSRQTTMLVIGEEGWPLEPDGHPSIKLQQVTELQQEGLPIRVLRESEWLRLLGLDDRCQEVRKLYTPAMLSQSLNVPIGTIRRWERLGLIRPVRKVYRLPYFDFEEAANVRRLNQLLEAGISRHQLEVSLTNLKAVMPGLDRPLAQLNLLAQDSRLLVRDSHGLVDPTTGQRCFNFSHEEPAHEPSEEPGGRAAVNQAAAARPDVIQERTRLLSVGTRGEPASDARTHWSGDQWFAEGCRLLDEHEALGAIEAFRSALLAQPGNPEVNFHLAEALFRAGNHDGALERYYAAAEADHDYLEAWTQIGCIYASRGELAAAAEAFQIALSVHGDYPDGHWHLADVLMQLGRTDEAALHWRKYLEFDSDGPWAERARQRLESVLSADSPPRDAEHHDDGVEKE
jgi:tetratricopeptide (TPR) repeat protein